jgi:hypothetical protein
MLPSGRLDVETIKRPLTLIVNLRSDGGCEMHPPVLLHVTVM